MIRVECGDGCLALRNDSKRGACLQKLLKASQYMAALYADEQPEVYMLGAAPCQVFLFVLDMLVTPQPDKLPWRQDYEVELVWEAHLLYISLGLDDVKTWPSSLIIDRWTAQWLPKLQSYFRVPSMSDMCVSPRVEATAYAAVMFRRPWERTGKNEPCVTKDGYCPKHGSGTWRRLDDGRWHELPNNSVWWPEMSLFASLTLLEHITVPPSQFSPVALAVMLWKILPVTAPSSSLRAYAVSLITYAEQLWPAYQHTSKNNIHRLAWMSSPHTISYELLMHGNKDNDDRIRFSDCRHLFKNNALAAMKVQPSDAFVQHDEELGAEVLRPFHECICPDAFLEHVTTTPRLAAAFTRLITHVSRQQAFSQNKKLQQRVVKADSVIKYRPSLHACFQLYSKYNYGLMCRQTGPLEKYELFLNAGAFRNLLTRIDFMDSRDLFRTLCDLQCHESSPLYTATLTHGLVRVVPSRAGCQERKDHHDQRDSNVVQSSSRWYYMHATITVYERLCDLKCDQFATIAAHGLHHRAYSAYLHRLQTGTDVCEDERSTMRQILHKAPKTPDFQIGLVLKRYRSIQAMLERKDVAQWALAAIKESFGCDYGFYEYNWGIQQVTVWR